MMWQDLWAALALVLVIEGMMPFLNPHGMRRVMIQMVKMDDRSLRLTGFVSMIAGAVLLAIVR